MVKLGVAVDFDCSNMIDLVEFFRFLFMYGEHFEQRNKKLVILEVNELMKKLSKKVNVNQSNESGETTMEIPDDGILEVGDDFIKYANGAHYKGGVNERKREGTGKLTAEDYIYDGEWLEDLKNG